MSCASQRSRVARSTTTCYVTSPAPTMNAWNRRCGRRWRPGSSSRRPRARRPCTRSVTRSSRRPSTRISSRANGGATTRCTRPPSAGGPCPTVRPAPVTWRRSLITPRLPTTWPERLRPGSPPVARAPAHTRSPAAARDLERALDLWDAVPADDRPTDVDQIQILHELSLARWRAAEMGGAVDAARRAVELSEQGTDVVRTASLIDRLGPIAWGAGDFEEA